MSFGGREPTDFLTARGRDWPSVRQFNVFLENRVGMLLELVRKLEASDNRIVALAVDDSADYAIIRIVLQDPDRAKETFDLSGIPYIESDLLVVQLPAGPHPLVQICKALLEAETNIHYAYPLMLTRERPALALHVDNHELAVAILRQEGFTILTESDLEK